MKENKISSVLKKIIGYALFICLFMGGLGFVGYLIAFVIGGPLAEEICTWIYKTYYVWLIKLSTGTTVACFVLAYLNGSVAWKNPFKKQ